MKKNRSEVCLQIPEGNLANNFYLSEQTLRTIKGFFSWEQKWHKWETVRHFWRQFSTFIL